MVWSSLNHATRRSSWTRTTVVSVLRQKRERWDRVQTPWSAGMRKSRAPCRRSSEVLWLQRVRLETFWVTCLQNRLFLFDVSLALGSLTALLLFLICPFSTMRPSLHRYGDVLHSVLRFILHIAPLFSCPTSPHYSRATFRVFLFSSPIMGTLVTLVIHTKFTYIPVITSLSGNAVYSESLFRLYTASPSRFIVFSSDQIRSLYTHILPKNHAFLLLPYLATASSSLFYQSWPPKLLRNSCRLEVSYHRQETYFRPCNIAHHGRCTSPLHPLWNNFWTIVIIRRWNFSPQSHSQNSIVLHSNDCAGCQPSRTDVNHTQSHNKPWNHIRGLMMITFRRG